MAHNPKTTSLMTISLPKKMAAKVEQTRKVEQRSRSELVREALRTYFELTQRPAEIATSTEIRAIKRGRREIARGNFVTLDQLRDELAKLDAQRQPRRRKKPAARSRA